MINGGSLAGIALFVYWAVAFTKLPFNKLIRDPQWSNWAIRIWAMGLGMVGSYVNLRLTTTGLVSQTEAYTTVLAAAVSTAAAIVSFHIGQPGFIDPLDGSSTVAVTVAQPPPVVSVASLAAPKTAAQYAAESKPSLSGLEAAHLPGNLIVTNPAITTATANHVAEGLQQQAPPQPPPDAPLAVGS